MLAFFKRAPEPDMIRLDTHKEIVAEIEKDAQAERETAARILQRNIELQGRVDDLAAEIATLRPDAEKHRERVRKASMNLKQNRAKAGASVRLEAAEPPADPYDTARDSRRDDREIHGL